MIQGATLDFEDRGGMQIGPDSLTVGYNHRAMANREMGTPVL